MLAWKVFRDINVGHVHSLFSHHSLYALSYLKNKKASGTILTKSIHSGSLMLVALKLNIPDILH